MPPPNPCVQPNLFQPTLAPIKHSTLHLCNATIQSSWSRKEWRRRCAPILVRLCLYRLALVLYTIQTFNCSKHSKRTRPLLLTFDLLTVVPLHRYFCSALTVVYWSTFVLPFLRPSSLLLLACPVVLTILVSFILIIVACFLKGRHSGGCLAVLTLTKGLECGICSGPFKPQ